MKTCRQCGGEMPDSKRGRPAMYCSPICASRAQVRPICRYEGCSKPSRKDFLCSPHYHAVHGEPERREPPVLTPCAACGEMWLASNKGPGYQGRRACSYLCRYYVQYGKWPSCEIGPRPGHSAPSVDLVAFARCQRCDARFPAWAPDRLYCTDSCKAAAQWARKIERRGVVPRFVAGRMPSLWYAVH